MFLYLKDLPEHPMFTLTRPWHVIPLPTSLFFYTSQHSERDIFVDHLSVPSETNVFCLLLYLYLQSYIGSQCSIQKNHCIKYYYMNKLLAVCILHTHN